jgi:iron complex outermembrane receptor protein
MRRSLTTLVTVALSASGSVAWGQDHAKATDDLDLVKLLNVQVSTATKTSESLDEAPAVITVVTKEDIHRWGYRNVAEVLNHCVGFYSIDDHILPNVAVRGMTGGLYSESGIVKVMIDGRSVAYRTTSGNWLDAELIPLESIRQIEIIRGPASALYGADAFLGVVNIITEGPDEARPVQARVLGGVTGSSPSGQVDLVANARSGHFDVLAGVVGEQGSRSGLMLPAQSPGPNVPDYVGARRIANNLDRTSLGLQLRIGYRVAEGHVIASAYASGFSRGGDFAPWAQLTNGTDATGNRVGTVISEGQLRLNLDSLYHVTSIADLAWQGTYSQGGILPADRVELGSDIWYAKRRTSYNGVDSTLEARIFPSKRFNVIGGIEAVYDHEFLGTPERIDRTTNQAVGFNTAADRRLNFSNLGAFVSSNLWVVDSWLKLTGGLRYDDHSVYGSQWTGRVGVVSPVSKGIVMKVLYGSAFKAPSPYLLYATPLGPGDVQGNPSLKPQKIDTVEYEVSVKPSGFFSATSGVSYNWLIDEAEFSPQGINLVAQNTANQTSFTWETRVDVKHYDDYAGYGSFEYVYSTRNLGDVGYAAQLVGNSGIVYPPYIGRLGASVGLPGPPNVPLTAGVEGMFVGTRRAADASVLANDGQFSLPPYVTLNMFVTTRNLYLVPGHESVVALRAYNVLGTTGPDPGFSGFEYPLPPREIFLELRHTY